MKNMERQYLDVLAELVNYGHKTNDRTGVGTYKLFGRQLRCTIRRNYPLLTTKQMYFKTMFRELQWFLAGKTSTHDLHKSVHPWWVPFADEDGELGPVYGRQYRDCRSYDDDGTLRTVDQLSDVLQSLEHNPTSRRHIISLWSPADIAQMRLPPCHGVVIQFNVRIYPSPNGELRTLDLNMYQRSADWFLGVPYNIASYALLLKMVASSLNYQTGDLIMNFGDVHLYQNHLAAAREQLTRSCFAEPLLHLNQPAGTSPLDRLLNFQIDHFKLQYFDYHPPIKAPLAV